MRSTTNDPQGEYMSKAEANAMDRIRSVAKEAASKVGQMMVAKAMEQAKRKEFEAIERNEYDEIMNAQEDADEAKYGEQTKREPMLSDERMNRYNGVTAMEVRDWFQAKIDNGELIRRDELEVNTKVCIKDGKHACCFMIGRDWFYNLITEAQYNEYIRRGANIIEWPQSKSTSTP